MNLPGPTLLAEDYDRIRPAFAETGTPRLPAGLNLGAQLFWQQKRFPAEFANAAAMLMYPQYWALRLTGVAANEATSLGCHTDLWNPWKADFSSLVDKMEWRRPMAPVGRRRIASAQSCPPLPSYGLDPQTPVLCGLHHSNASLLPHLLSDAALLGRLDRHLGGVDGGWRQQGHASTRPATRSSTSTRSAIRCRRHASWAVVVFAADGRPNRKTGPKRISPQCSRRRRPCCLRPNRVRGRSRITSARLDADGITTGQRFAVISFYLALMTATCLDLIGADGPTIVEGPFARNRLFTRMLAAATARAVIASEAATGTSIGAALLASDHGTAQGKGEKIEPPADPAWADYGRSWRAAVDAQG